jgi:CheY-like chemotaxis protein
MKVLILDDQIEIFNSIQPTLNAARFKAQYAGTIEDAIRMIQDQTFDLAFVDLQMPPGNWGGLEAIRQLRIADRELPLVVLSGKGSLAECIEAVRLGASDYIQKESFDADFHRRVVPNYQRPYAIQRFPSLLGYLHRVYQEEKNPYLKARKMMDVYEFSIRLVALFVLCEISGKSSGERISNALNKGLERASLGSFVAFIFDQLAGSSMSPFLEATRRSDFKECRRWCDQLTRSRNENFGHSVTITGSQAASLLELMNEPLTRILNAMSFLRRFELFLVESLKYDGSCFTVEGKILRGDNLLHPSGTVKTDVPVKTNEIVVFAGGQFVVGLDPFVRIQPLGSGDQYAYAIYDKLVGSKIQYSVIPRNS